VRRILVHFLKLAYSPARDPRLDWMDAVIDARAELDDKLSPSLRRDIEEALARLYDVARKRVTLDLSKFGERGAARGLPQECPYTIEQILIEQILADDWYPAPADPANEPQTDTGRESAN
jgi:hypothetical protein